MGWVATRLQCRREHRPRVRVSTDPGKLLLLHRPLLCAIASGAKGRGHGCGGHPAILEAARTGPGETLRNSASPQLFQIPEKWPLARQRRDVVRGGEIDSASAFLDRPQLAEDTRDGEDAGGKQVQRSTRLIAWLLPFAWGLLLAAWVIANPPFAAPDEAAHYLRAIGLSDGHLIGEPAPQAEIGLTKRQRAWTRQAARLIRVPPGLSPEPYGCEVGNPVLSAACLEAAKPDRSEVVLTTPVGNYQPLP